MSSFLQTLAEQRRKFLQGLDANEGDINLDIFEDFYPDQAHFVFELLQNAEDAGATEAAFTLTTDGCAFEHNGTRTFDEPDVRAITGIHNSTKSNTPDQIGKFGVGFKSVFVYTLTPTVRSGDFSFQISRLVLPEPIEHDPTIGTRTRFWLPFNHPQKTPDAAHAEVGAGLSELAETTLLFLVSLQSIRWRISQAASGEVLRVQHSRNHFEVVKQIDGQAATRSHFLKFDQPVAGLEKQRVAIAFALDFLPNVQHFDPTNSLALQMKIIPATPGRVAVFFPAEKETSGLRFHLHAPFVPELSRASLKETPANQPLFRQLATLTAASLHDIRDLGLLTADFLSVLPNSQDQIPPKYQDIRTAIVEEMNIQPLTPTHTKSHAPAKHLLQAKASIKDLLTEEDLALLVEYSDQPKRWAVGATQRNSDADRFLAGLAISEWDIDEFVELVSQRASEGTRYIPSPPHFVEGPDQEFMAWLSRKPVPWHQAMYSLLHLELSPSRRYASLNGLRIVRLGDGTYSVGTKCFFPSDGVNHDEVLPSVEPQVYGSGRNRTQQENARKFLEEIGVREVGEAEQIEALLTRRYTKDTLKPNKRDLKRFVALVEKDSTKARLFSDYFIFEAKDGKWRKPSGVFLDQPFMDTGLAVYYEALGKDAKRAALAGSYRDCGVALQRLVTFGQAVGVQTRLPIQRKSVWGHSFERELRADWYGASVRRTNSEINEDWHIEGLQILLEGPTRELSKLIWETLGAAEPGVLTARYRPNQQYTTRTAPSSLVLELRKGAWIPQSGGSFVRPSEASRDSLPEGFPFDPGWLWLKVLHFGQEVAKKSEKESQKQAIAKELGFADDESLERARRFAALPPKEQERILAAQERAEASDLPEHEPTNPERRAERVGAQAANAPERSTEERIRSVSVGRDEVKEKAAQYLRQQYTNPNGEMICQVCKGPLPFKLDDGSDYFETVELLSDLKKRHYQNYLALCPNHAAMFQYANGSADLMRDMFVELTGNELEVVLAQKDVTLYFTKTHIADLKKVITVDQAESDQSLGEVAGGDA